MKARFAALAAAILLPAAALVAPGDKAGCADPSLKLWVVGHTDGVGARSTPT